MRWRVLRCRAHGGFPLTERLSPLRSRSSAATRCPVHALYPRRLAPPRVGPSSAALAQPLLLAVVHGYRPGPGQRSDVVRRRAPVLLARPGRLAQDGPPAGAIGRGASVATAPARLGGRRGFNVPRPNRAAGRFGTTAERSRLGVARIHRPVRTRRRGSSARAAATGAARARPSMRDRLRPRRMSVRPSRELRRPRHPPVRQAIVTLLDRRVERRVELDGSARWSTTPTHALPSRSTRPRRERRAGPEGAARCP